MYNADSSASERRRTARLRVEGAADAGLVGTNSVRVVDISVGGVLLASPRPAAVGVRGRLSLTIAGNPLAAEVEIRRVAESSDQDGYRIGAMFIGITPAQRETIERLESH